MVNGVLFLAVELGEAYAFDRTHLMDCESQQHERIPLYL